MPTDQTLISTFLKKHSIFDAAEVDRITKLANAVSTIPWGEGRTIEEVLSTKGVGTCTGKHLVLQKCFDALGIVWRPVVCTFRWSEQGLHLPEHLEKILQEGEWEHGHNFVQVQNQNTKQWIDVDVTWDPPLAAFGFLVLPQSWNGETSSLGMRTLLQRWDNASIADKKKELIASLSEEQQERRERFLHAFIEWISTLRK